MLEILYPGMRERNKRAVKMFPFNFTPMEEIRTKHNVPYASPHAHARRAPAGQTAGLPRHALTSVDSGRASKSWRGATIPSCATTSCSSYSPASEVARITS